MNKTEFAKIALGLETYFNGFKLRNDQMGLWYDAIDDLDYNICAKAIKKLAQTSKFAPTIAGIREAYMEIKNGDLPSLEKTLNDMQIVANRFGRYQIVEGLQWLQNENPVGYRIMKAISYNSYANNDVTYMQPTIKKLHTEIVQNDADTALLQSKFASEIGSINARGLLMNGGEVI